MSTSDVGNPDWAAVTDFQDLLSEWDDLSVKERAVMSCISKGATIKELCSHERLAIYSPSTIRATLQRLMDKGKVHRLAHKDGKQHIYGRNWQQKVITNGNGIFTTELPKIVVRYGKETYQPYEIVEAMLDPKTSSRHMTDAVIKIMAKLWIQSFYKQMDLPITVFQKTPAINLARELHFWREKARAFYEFVDIILKLPIWDDDAVGLFSRLIPVGTDPREIAIRLETYLLAQDEDKEDGYFNEGSAAS